MGIIVIVFYPLFTKMEEWVKKISTKFIRTGKSVGGKYAGLLAAFLIALAVLFYFYARMWYKIDFAQLLLHGDIGKYL
jgi:dolichol kinase